MDLKQKTKKALKSALIGDDLSQKSVPELISERYEEDSDSDESESTELEDMDDEDMDSDIDAVMEDDGEAENSEEEADGSDSEDDSDSDDEIVVKPRAAAVSFVPKGSIQGVNMSAQNNALREKLLARINAVRTGRKVAPLDAEGNLLTDLTPHSKRRASMEKKTGKSKEPEMSRREKKNLKKRLRKEEALKSLPKSLPPHASRSAVDSDDEHAPAKKKVKVVEDDLDFGKVRFEDGHAKTHFEQKQERRDSKHKTLAKLQRQQAYEKKLEGTETGEQLKEDKAWSKTFKRLEGEKVKDRADLLKKSIKREESAKRKSKREWDERKATVRTSQDERAKKRAANIRERLDAHKLKRTGKKGNSKKQKK